MVCVYAKRPFGGPKAGAAPTCRATPTASRSPTAGWSRADDAGVTFNYKDYRIEGPDRYKTMTLRAGEFIRRFLMHVLPKGFHRIRHYGLLANGNRADNIARARELLAVPAPRRRAGTEGNAETDHPACCRIPVRAAAGACSSSRPSRRCEPKYRPAPATPAIRIDTS